MSRALLLVEGKTRLSPRHHYLEADHAYDLVRRRDWPTPVLHVGKLIKSPSAPLLALLSEQPEVTLHADFGERLRA